MYRIRYLRHHKGGRQNMRYLILCLMLGGCGGLNAGDCWPTGTTGTGLQCRIQYECVTGEMGEIRYVDPVHVACFSTEGQVGEPNFTLQGLGCDEPEFFKQIVLNSAVLQLCIVKRL